MKQRTAQILSFSLFLGLLIWGVFTLLSYLGVPVHGMVLFTEAGQKAVDAACPGGGFVCRGLFGFFPFLIHAAGRASPFFWYAALSVVAYFLFVGWRGVQTGEFRLRFTWRPWHIVALFVGCAWLLFTVLSLGTTDGASALQIVEPTQQAYGEIGAGPLASLKENFDALQARGCLSLLGESDSGIKVYRMRGICVQGAFVTRVLPPLLFVILLIFECLVAGRFLLRLLRVRPRTDLEEATLGFGLGAGAWIAALWFLAVFGTFTYPFGWALVLFIPLLLYKQTLYWLKKFVSSSYETDVPWHSVSSLLLWLLVSYLAFNFLTVVRPFPIGWDDLGSYLNRPRLLVSYGHFIPSMAPFQWEYLTALGFLLFGYDSTFGAIASMMVNWMAGILAVLAVLLFARTFLGGSSHSTSSGQASSPQAGRGILAALLYYSLPLVGHFSFADMKIDNAVFAMGALAMYAVFAALFPRAEDGDAPEELPPARTGFPALLPARWEWFLLGGILMGFAIAAKITSAMVLLALLAVILGMAGWTGFIGGLFIGAFVLLRQGVDISVIAHRIGMTLPSPPLIVFGILVIGLLLIVAAFVLRRRAAVHSFLSLLLFCAGIAIAVFPWVENNNLARGRIIPRLELGQENTITPLMDYAGISGLPPGGRVRTLPEDLRVDIRNPACQATGSKEELDRYWGFGKGWGHYLTLPWRTVMNVDSAGYYVTTIPVLLLFPLLLLLPFFWSKKGRWLRFLFLATFFIIFQWMFLANGILWYGMGMFLGLAIALEALVARAPDTLNRAAVSTLLTFSLIIAFGMRFWQFEQQRNLLEYPFGKVSADTLRIRTIPYYDQIRALAVQRNASMPDRPYLYRVGTFITYFIPKNLEVIGMTDHQLDQFNCLNQERDHQLTLKRLKALGFNSIIFDTNTATIEKDPNGSLHKKAQEFVSFLNDSSLGLQVVISDSNQGVAFILIP